MRKWVAVLLSVVLIGAIAALCTVGVLAAKQKSDKLPPVSSGEELPDKVPDEVPEVVSEKVLKVEWQNLKNNTWHEYGEISAEPLSKALSELSDEQISNAVLTYWIYNDNDTYCYQASYRFKSGAERIGKSDYLSKNTWTMVSVRLGDLCSSVNGLNCEPSELATKITSLAFYLSGYDVTLTDDPETSDVHERYPATGETLTLYVSDISLTISDPNDTRTIKVYDFSAEGVESYFMDFNCSKMTVADISEITASEETAGEEAIE